MSSTGIVKWFNSAKGYGFICPEDGGKDIFVHFSSIDMEGYRCLRAGQEVSFEVQDGPKGLHAINIKAGSNDASTTYNQKTIVHQTEREELEESLA